MVVLAVGVFATTYPTNLRLCITDLTYTTLAILCTRAALIVGTNLTAGAVFVGATIA